MAAGKARKGAQQASPASGGDRIGALPDETLHHILSFLPAQQAVRTCVLARRWRHIWKSATGLRIVGADGKTPVRFTKKARKFVDSLLLLRGSSPLETFELKVAGAPVDIRHVMLWVGYAVQHKVQIEDCIFKHAGRISSHSLRHLSIKEGAFNPSCRARIIAPNLASLVLEVTAGRTPVFEKMPLLVKASVRMYRVCNDCCSHSNYGNCGDVSCGCCIQDESASVILHGLSQAKSLVLLACPD